jgi:hypothetical protein
MLIALPFSGFYETLHAECLESALESTFTDEEGNPTLETAYLKVSWKKAHEGYAKVYTLAMSELTGLDFKFESITFPREYNFESETLYANVAEKAVQRLFATTNTPGLSTLARERFTSRDGFLSFYSPDLTNWPQDPTTWDHNQLGCLLQAYLDQEHPSSESGRFCQWAELELLEHARCNGVIEGIVHAALP